MKLPHELDERVVVAESVGPRVVKGHHQECPRRPPPSQIGRDDIKEGCGAEEPEVSSQPSNVGANGDDSLPMSLRLVLNREGDEIGKVPQRWRESRCLGVARIVGGPTVAPPGTSASQHHEGERWMCQLRAWPESLQPTELDLPQPSRCSSPQLKVGPGVFGIVLLEARWGTSGKGDELPQ
ncbi:hypothetical protein GOBAR_AA17551 [Gossypium barbadense]|uniref:Uncharacterized protein n=1 Tax=Gossypium barbadense TaxID=3634 RepID=A0A2P5XIC4_GOSBA|nr:hypothetical protein GOBAR_AA17551 [Gossypium barbadense]